MYNFKDEVERGDLCRGNCDRQVRVFRLYESGKCVIVGTTPEEWRNTDRSDVLFEREFTVPNWLVRKAFRDMVREFAEPGSTSSTAISASTMGGVQGTHQYSAKYSENRVILMRLLSAPAISLYRTYNWTYN